MSIVLKPNLAQQLEQHGLILGESVILSQPVIFNGPARIYDYTSFEFSAIDAFSSVGTSCSICTTVIGRYTTIGRGCIIGTKASVPGLLVNSPALYANQVFTRAIGIIPKELPSYKNRVITTYPVKIGNDVTIGNNVIIHGEITVGNGAVIESNSYVVEDVPAYAIVRGNPGVIVGYRFTEEQIAELEKAQLWQYNLPAAVLKRVQFFQDNIEEFIETAKRLNYDLNMPKIEEKYRQIKIFSEDSCDLLKCTRDTLPYSLEERPKPINLD